MIKWPDNSDASAWYYLAVQEATNSHAYSDKSKDDKYEKWTTIATLVTGPSLKSKLFVSVNREPQMI